MSNPRPTSLSREQRLWLAGVLTLAAGLRFFGIGSLSLSHMDEGGYISGAMTVATGGPFSFPYSQALQSPPLLAWLIGGMIWLFQVQWPILGILLSAMFGTGSVGLLFLLARRWGGNQFGLCAATLLAASDFHIAYSRMLLTDVPLTFWFLLTLYCATRLWESCEAGRSDADVPDDKAKKNFKRHTPSQTGNRWLLVISWGMATGLAAGAGWNTKYNGWLVLAIAMTAAGLWAVLQRLPKLTASAAPPLARTNTRVDMLLCGLIIATVIAAFSYAPWYVYVEQEFPGGYAAVSANHRRYFSSPEFWPAHAQSLIASLSALRHYGWIATIGLVAGLAVRLLGRWTKPGETLSSPLRAAGAVALVLGLAAVVMIQGGDAALILLGIAGILPALLSGSWPRLLAAVWCGTFFVLTPLYHPYPRLMLPALPACIVLTLWLLEDAWPLLIRGSATVDFAGDGPFSRRNLAGASLVLGAALSLVWLAGSHPFGLTHPTRGVWSRWSTHESYRAAGQAILEHTDADAIVICQTQLALISYCPRTAIIAEDHSYQTLFEGFPKDRSCYLAVDFGWIYQHADSEALRGIVDDTENLTPLAVIPNDLNIVTLLDFLTPAEAAAKLAEDHSPNRLGPRQLPVPPSLSAPYQDVIVLYRVKWPR